MIAKRVIFKKTGLTPVAIFQGRITMQLSRRLYYAKPLIISNTPGNRPLINDMNDGLLFDVKDSDEFSRKVQLLLTNKNLKEKLSINAKKKSLQLMNLNKSKADEKLYFSAMIKFKEE